MLTVIISVVALTVSIVSTYLNSRQKKFETERTLRSQLTDVFGKLTALNLEIAKIPEQGASSSGLTRGMTGHIRDQQRFLIRQATYLSDQIPQLTTPFEYLLIAGGFTEIGDISKAETFFKKARDSAYNDPLNLGFITRSFARLLFSEGEIDLARQQYAGAIEIFSGEGDQMKEFRGDTYLRWGTQELEWADAERALSLFDEAKKEFESKAHPVARTRSLKRLDDHVNRLSGLSRELAAFLETSKPIHDASQNELIDSIHHDAADG